MGAKRRKAAVRQDARKRRKKGGGGTRRVALWTAFVLLVLLGAWMYAGSWFVHHPRRWVERRLEEWPGLVTAPLMWIGPPVGDVTDALGWTGHDAVYEYDMEAPSGEVFFAGAPRRVGPPAPNDITIVDRGPFKVGWSPSLRHPVWVAYHVPKEAKFGRHKRPNFLQDKSVRFSPPSGSYHGSHYDRGHMAPNYAITTRFGTDAQRQTFLMSNVSPQSPALNRGVWREVERRIADLWTSRYGEIWVIVGCVPSGEGATIRGTGIDIPDAYYQILVAQEGMDVRALALLYPQDVPWREWPARGLVTIDEIEELTGLDFLPELSEFIQTPLEAELPSRLWPVRLGDVPKLLSIHYGTE